MMFSLSFVVGSKSEEGGPNLQGHRNFEVLKKMFSEKYEMALTGLRICSARQYVKGIALSGVIAILMIATRKRK